MATVNWAEWVQAIAALISAGVAVVLINQLSLAKDQLRLTQEQLELGVKWNQLSAAFTFFSGNTFTESERVAAESLSKLNVDLYHQEDALPSDIVKAVLQDANHFREIKSLLNYLEDYAAAVHTEVMDSDVSYRLMSDLVTRYYDVFKPLIKVRRDEIGNQRLWIEFEKLALVWAPRRVEEEQRLIKQIEEARALSVKLMNDIIIKRDTPGNTYRRTER
jgi:hypothetical protein